MIPPPAFGPEGRVMWKAQEGLPPASRQVGG